MSNPKKSKNPRKKYHENSREEEGAEMKIHIRARLKCLGVGFLLPTGRGFRGFSFLE